MPMNPAADYRAPALVLGMSIHGLAIARALARQGIKVFAFEQSATQPSKATRYADIRLVDGINSERTAEILLEKRKLLPAGERVVLFPSSDNMVRSIAARWPELEPHYALSWGDATEIVTRLVDKSSLADICKARSMDYPYSALVHDAFEARSALNDIGLPALVKPIKPLSGFKALLIETPMQLSELVQHHAADLPFLVQRWVSGGDEQLHFCSMLLDQGQPISTFTGRKLRSFPSGTGVGTIVESNVNEEVLELSHRFVEGLGLSGPIAIEYKRDDDGRYWLIEPNVGRTEYSVDLIIQSGRNFPVLEYLLAQAKPTDAVAQSTHEVIWYDTEREPLSYLGMCWRQRSLRPFGKRAVFPYAGHGDPRPLMRATTRLLKRLGGMPGNRVRRLFHGPAVATIRRFTNFAALPAAAIVLLERKRDENMFIGPEWFQNYETEVAGKEGTFFWACIYDSSDELRGVWPLVRQSHKGRSFLHVMGNYYTPYASLPFDFDGDDAEALFLNALRQIVRGVDWLELAPVAPDDPVMNLLQRSPNAIRNIISESTINWFQAVTSLTAYHEQLPSRVRSTLKRKARALTRTAEVEYRIVSGGADLETAIDDYFEVYNKSWKPLEPYPDFIRGLIRLAAEKSWLRLGLLYVDGVAAAGQIWLVRDGTAHIYKLAYVKEFARASVGTLLTWHMVESSVQNDGVTKLDYLTGNDNYKKDWMNESRALYDVSFINLARPMGALRYLRHRLAYPSNVQRHD